MRYLARTTLDHAPMLIRLGTNIDRYGTTSFKFQQVWTIYEIFKDCVLKVRKVNSEDSGL